MAPSRPAVYPDQIGLVILTVLVIVMGVVALVIALTG